jgi:DNA-binding MarR family transcriptional regulator
VQSAQRSFTRLARFINKLMREQMACGPVTVQQCYALEALASGPMNMTNLATELALHQSTLTRVIDKLAKLGLVRRCRKDANQRVVEVELTDLGRHTHAALDSCGAAVIAQLLEMIPTKRRATVVESTELLAELLDPARDVVGKLLADNCCATIIKGSER